MSTNVRRQLRKWWRALKNEQADPRRMGIAVGVGVVVGCSPFFGAQTLLAIGLAWLFGLNRIATLLGAQISVPPLTPLVIFASAQTGAWIVRGHFLSLTLGELRALPPRQLVASFLTDLLVGGVVVGGTIGLVAGTLTTRWLRSRASSTRLELTDALLDALDERLEALPRRWRSYGGWKVRLDPIYPLALSRLGTVESVVDLGAGMGLLAALVALDKPGARVRAVEWDARKVAMGRRLVSGLSVELVEEDGRTADLGHPDAILLVDVLHYFDLAEQRRWLARCVQALAPERTLVVRELAAGGSGAGWLERAAVSVGWNRGPGIQAWPQADMIETLTSQGFAVETFPAGRGLFRSNWMLVARRKKT